MCKVSASVFCLGHVGAVQRKTVAHKEQSGPDLWRLPAPRRRMLPTPPDVHVWFMSPPLLQAECQASDLKESYDVRWGVFAAQTSPAGMGDVPFPVHADDSHLLLEVLLWGAQVASFLFEQSDPYCLRWRVDLHSSTRCFCLSRLISAMLALLFCSALLCHLVATSC